MFIYIHLKIIFTFILFIKYCVSKETTIINIIDQNVNSNNVENSSKYNQITNFTKNTIKDNIVIEESINTNTTEINQILNIVEQTKSIEKNCVKQLLLFSSLSGIGSARTLIDHLLSRNNITTVLFIPYAHYSYDYSEFMYSPYLTRFGYSVESIHKKNDSIAAIKNAQAIFIGGGNTFVLLKTLYDQNLIEPIKEQVLKNGIPYIGSSAGTNVATRSIHTTNDMPIVYPPSLNALNLLPFNINPHYDDSENGILESRKHRIYQFLEHNNASVLGMKNTNILSVKGNNIKLFGSENAVLFKRDGLFSYEPESDLSFLSQLE